MSVPLKKQKQPLVRVFSAEHSDLFTTSDAEPGLFDEHSFCRLTFELASTASISVALCCERA